MVQLDGATISLPAGWIARDYAHYLPKGEYSLATHSWCLTPSGLAASTKPGACPVQLGMIDPSGNPVDVNIEGGFSSNPEYCGMGGSGAHTSEQSADRLFGGRQADWRRWEISCGAGLQYLIEQYVVATGPGYILYSERADASVHDAMAEIAAHSQLPPQTLPLRFCDEGYLRSVHQTVSGVEITLDRIAYDGRKVINENPATYAYLVPTKVFDEGHRPGVGTLVHVSTDGRQVTSI